MTPGKPTKKQSINTAQRVLTSFLLDKTMLGVSRFANLSRFIPTAQFTRYNVERIQNISYQDSGKQAHLLDIYRPTNTQPPYTVVFYVHGGGFRILSKDSHWFLALLFARKGFLVCNINYRLAPKYPYPAAHQDTFSAFQWVRKSIAHYGGDPENLILAGESAGANLVTSLALSCCYEREEPWAREVFRQNILPRAVIAACGLLQVSDILRFTQKRKIAKLVANRMEQISLSFLPNQDSNSPTLADPLLLLEQKKTPKRALPPFFAPVGTNDPILDDTNRLKRALDALESFCELRHYPGEVHAFHAMLWRKQARKCWRDTFAFLQQHLSNEP